MKTQKIVKIAASAAAIFTIFCVFMLFYPKKWFFEATPFDGVPVTPPLLDAPPVTLEDYLAAQ